MTIESPVDKTFTARRIIRTATDELTDIARALNQVGMQDLAMDLITIAGTLEDAAELALQSLQQINSSQLQHHHENMGRLLVSALSLTEHQEKQP